MSRGIIITSSIFGVQSMRMKAFSVEKVLESKTSGINGRLGSLQLPVKNEASEDNQEPGGGGCTSNSIESEDRAYRTPLYFLHTQVCYVMALFIISKPS